MNLNQEQHDYMQFWADLASIETLSALTKGQRIVLAERMRDVAFECLDNDENAWDECLTHFSSVSKKQATADLDAGRYSLHASGEQSLLLTQVLPLLHEFAHLFIYQPLTGNNAPPIPVTVEVVVSTETGTSPQVLYRADYSGVSSLSDVLARKAFAEYFTRLAETDSDFRLCRGLGCTRIFFTGYRRHRTLYCSAECSLLRIKVSQKKSKKRHDEDVKRIKRNWL